jgi:CRISPR-associated protein Cmr5
MQTQDQKYSACVYRQVVEIRKEKEYKKYGAMAHKLPILIHTAGLVQALEFVNSRGSAIQKRLLEHLAITIGKQDAKTLLEAAHSGELSEYMHLTRQVQAALLWYKRFAQSILEVDVTEAAGEETRDDRSE